MIKIVRKLNSKWYNVTVVFFFITCLLIFSSMTTFSKQSSLVLNSNEFNDNYNTGIVKGDYGVDLWYAKVDTSYISTLYTAFVSEKYPPPFLSVLVQHFFGPNDTEIFYGLSLLAIEFFEDSNNNSILDYYPNEGINELRYSLLLNASERSIVSNISKTTKTSGGLEIITYKWSYTYYNLQTLLVYPNGSLTNMDVNVFIKNFTLVYELNILLNKTTNSTECLLKQNIEIDGLNGYPLENIKDLGLSILFAMSIASNKHVKILADGKEINSKDPNFTEVQFNNASLMLGDIKFLDLGLHENYTLLPDNTTYPVKAAAYPISSLDPYSWVISDPSKQFIYRYIEKVYSSQLGENITPSISYENADLVYRLSYKYWYSDKLIHDPTIRSYPSQRRILSYSSSPILSYAGIITLSVGFLFAVFAIYRRKKVTKSIKTVLLAFSNIF